MSTQPADPVGAMFAQLLEAQARSLRRLQEGDVDELLESVGLDDQALRTWARHVESNAVDGMTIGAAFTGGLLLALELVGMRSA